MLRYLICLIVLAIPAFAQVSTNRVILGDPPGGAGAACTAPATNIYLAASGLEYTCYMNVWSSVGSAGSGTVTSIAETFTGGLISVAGSPITTSGTFALTVAGTSGGVPYFSSGSTWASSAALTVNLPMVGGGAGNPPTVGTRSGNTTAFVTTTGAQTSGDCVKIDANGNHIANGSACGSGGTGDVVGPGSATDLAVAIYDGTTGKLIKNSLCTVASTGILTCVGFATSDNTHSGLQIYNGVTSGTVGLAAADIAGTAIVYVLPSTNGAAGQVLKDNGSTTCPTLASGAPSTCHLLIWDTLTLASADFANQGTTTTLLHGNAAGNPSFAAVVSNDLNITTTTCTNQVVSAISAGGVGTCHTIVSADLPAASKSRMLTFNFDGGGSALATGNTVATTIPYACTISAYNIFADAGTATIKTWRKATGTAIPTSMDSISTSGVSLSSGTAVHSTTVSDFTDTTLDANDILIFQLSAVATATWVSGGIQCDI